MSFTKVGFNHGKAQIIGSVALWCLVISFSTLSIRSAEIRVLIADILSGNPVPNARVTFRQRSVTVDARGVQRLRPLHEGPILGIEQTGLQGESRFEVGDKAGFISIEVTADGFESQVDTLFPVRPETTAEKSFLLIRAQLSDTQRDLIRAFHEAARNEEQIEQGPYIPPADGQVHATAAVVVPDEVHVENLNGFTGMMNLDEFIGGVVTREMNDGFPREALRTQAVASRSYALHRLRTRGMANGGQAYNSTSGNLSRAAAFYTSRQVLLYNGSIAQAFFSARCNGDFTLDSEDGPTLSRCFQGGLTTAVVPFCRSRPCSGHINCSETSEQCCVVTIDNKVNHIYGHGVGMCQRGAQQFANRGSNYVSTLHNYYTGVTLHTGNAGTNSIQLRIVKETNPPGSGPSFLLEIRSGQPSTIFDVQSKTSLSSASWTSIVPEQGLSTGATSVTQIRPQGVTATAQYFRAIIR